MATTTSISTTYAGEFAGKYISAALLSGSTIANGGGSAPSIGGGGNMAAASVAPSFNVVGASPTNQLAQTIGNKEQQPIKAYVVSADVSTAQSLDRNIISSATLG